MKSRVLTLALVWLMALPAWAQTPQSAQAAKVKARAETLPIGGRVTVNMRDGAQYCGTIGSLDAESLLVHEVDLKQDLTLRYDQIERVRKDYGRPGFGGRRVYPRTSRITGLIVVGVLVGIVIAAVAADKS